MIIMFVFFQILIELKFWSMVYHTAQEFDDQITEVDSAEPNVKNHQKGLEKSETTRHKQKRSGMIRKDQNGSILID